MRSRLGRLADQGEGGEKQIWSGEADDEKQMSAKAKQGDGKVHVLGFLMHVITN